jgi:hypothetical protein
MQGRLSRATVPTTVAVNSNPPRQPRPRNPTPVPKVPRTAAQITLPLPVWCVCV